MQFLSIPEYSFLLCFRNGGFKELVWLDAAVAETHFGRVPCRCLCWVQSAMGQPLVLAKVVPIPSCPLLASVERVLKEKFLQKFQLKDNGTIKWS